MRERTKAIVGLISAIKFKNRSPAPVLRSQIVFEDGSRMIPRAIDPGDGKPHLGADVGCGDLEVSLALLNEFPTLSMYAVDHYLEPQDGDGETESDRLIFARRMSKEVPKRLTLLSIECSKAAERVSGRKFDFVILDANPKLIERDIQTWRPLMIDGGAIIIPAALESDFIRGLNLGIEVNNGIGILFC